MEKILFKEIVKVTLVFVSPLVILSLLFFDGQLGIALGISIGALLGIFRLRIFFNYIICSLNQEKSSKDKVSLIKYLISLIFTIGAIGFTLVKSVAIGLALLFGLITVSITVMIYTMLKGISLYRKK